MHSIIIPVKKGSSVLEFEIRDYPHDDDDEHNCKFEVYLENKFIASFEPDRQGHLHICKNPGGMEEKALHILSDEIEKYHW